MTWSSFHNRGEALREAITVADTRLDGTLPMDLAGVKAAFEDEGDLLAALMLKWHTRLAGNVERALAEQPLDLEAAVADAWLRTSRQMPGVRAIMDRYAADPAHADLQSMLERAQEREWSGLAVQAGLANASSAAASRVGQRIEAHARQGLSRTPVATPEPTERAAADSVSPSHGTPSAELSFVDRIKAVLAA